MVMFILMAINALIAAYPARAGMLGRALAVLNVFDIYLFHLARSGAKLPDVMGLVARLVRPDALSAGAEVSTACAMTVVAAVGLLANRRFVTTFRLAQLTIRLPGWVAPMMIAAGMLSALFLIASVGPATLVSYQGYGSIKAGAEAGANIERLAGVILRASTMLLIAVAIPRLSRGGDWTSLVALVPILLAVLIGLAEASRIVAIYAAVAAVSLMLSRRIAAAVIVGLFALLAVIYSLEARAHNELGLAHVPTRTMEGLTRDSPLTQVTANVSARLVILSVSVQAAAPEQYSRAFKTLSFLPTVDAIDGFQAEKARSEQRIGPYLPFSAFAEAYLFGPFYFLLFWSIAALAASSVNALGRHGIVLMLVALCIFVLGWSSAGQYPTRNCMRYFYAIIALRYLMELPWVRRRSAALVQVLRPLVPLAGRPMAATGPRPIAPGRAHE